jgi:hypothetical protein
MTHEKLARLGIVTVLLLAFASPLSAEWKEKVLYSFQGGANDGFFPAGGVVFDKQGNLYGATTGGGPATCAPFGSECGTVFQLSPPAQKGGSWTETLLYQFQGKGSNDGSVPNGGLIIDAAGNLYGMTAYGGTGYCLLLGANAGCGTVYEISPPQQPGGAWTETILYSFPTAKEGYLPNGNLVFDSAGNLYGATTFGGDEGTTCDSLYGGQCGVAFELNPPKTKGGGKWTEKVLHGFAGGTDGAEPNGGLVLNSNGAVSGTTFSGGNQSCKGDGNVGCGTVFELAPQTITAAHWTETILHRFRGYPGDGELPSAGLVSDAEGNVYGTATGGGSDAAGIVFGLSKAGGHWAESILHTFTGTTDGALPHAGLTFDSLGNLYGAARGGTLPGGVAFRLSPKRTGNWGYSLLYNLGGPPNGKWPDSTLVFEGPLLYGTTTEGGSGGTCEQGCGTIFELGP